MCTDNTPCGAGRQCIDPGKYNAKCDPCPSGTQCTCPSGQVADGSGGCGVAGCAGALAAARPDVAIAEDEAGLAVALISDKSIIAVLKSFSSGTELNIGNKTLVGPKYFSTVSACSGEATPTLSKNTETAAGIKLAGGTVSDLNITYSYAKSGAAAISGYGNLKNISIKKGSNSYSMGIAVTGGAMNLDGKIDIATTSTGISVASGSTLYSKANVSMTGDGGYMSVAGTLRATAGSFTIKKEGSGTPLSIRGNAYFDAPLVVEGDGWLNAGIDLGDSSILSMSGNGNKITVGESMAIKGGTVTIGGTTSIVFRTCYSVFRNTRLTINGAVTISTPCTYQQTRDSKSIFLLTGPSNAVKYYVNAPLTVTGGSLSLGYFEGGLLSLGANANVGGNIGGYSSWYDTKNYGSVLKVTSGARLKLGGTCRKATSTKDLDPYKSPNGFYLNHGSSGTWKVFEQLPNPPFAGSC